MRQSQKDRDALVADFDRRLAYSEATGGSDIIRAPDYRAIVVHQTADDPSISGLPDCPPPLRSLVDSYFQYGDSIYVVETCTANIAAVPPGIYHRFDGEYRNDVLRAVISDAEIYERDLIAVFDRLKRLVDQGTVERVREGMTSEGWQWIADLHPREPPA